MHHLATKLYFAVKEGEMRFLVKVTIPTEAGNQMVRDPNFGQTMQEVLTGIKAEASYFTETDGQRTAFIIVNM